MQLKHRMKRNRKATHIQVEEIERKRREAFEKEMEKA